MEVNSVVVGCSSDNILIQLIKLSASLHFVSFFTKNNSGKVYYFILIFRYFFIWPLFIFPE